MKVEMKWLSPGEDVALCKEIRMEVFCHEQGFSLEEEMDNKDGISHHLLMLVDGVASATGRVVPMGPGYYRLGRIAVRRTLRGTGLGRELVDELRRKAQALGGNRIEIDSQCRVVGFYEKCGFVVTGSEHLDGHVPHIEMEWRPPVD